MPYRCTTAPHGYPAKYFGNVGPQHLRGGTLFRGTVQTLLNPAVHDTRASWMQLCGLGSVPTQLFVCIRCVWYSGGTMVTVSGERLDLVLNPSLAVYVTDDVFTGVSFVRLLFI